MAKKTFQVSFPVDDTDTLVLVDKIREAEKKKTGNKPNRSEVFRMGVRLLAAQHGLVKK